MKLMHYIRGDRKGENARDMEMDILRDKFLADAIAGFDSSDEAGELSRDIAVLQKEVVAKSFVRRPKWLWWIFIVILLIAVSILYLVYCSEPSTDTKPVSEEPVAATETASAGQTMGEGIVREQDMPVETVEVGGVVAPDSGQDSGQAGGLIKEPEPVAADKTPVNEETPPVVKPAARTYNGEALLVVNTPDPENASGFLTTPRTGIRKYSEYLSKARMLPDEDKRGDVVVSFRVNQYGRPSSMRIESSPSQEANKEAIRLLDGGPEWHSTEERVTVVIRLK